MDYNELLFAAAVRDLAASIKSRASNTYYLTISLDDPEIKQKRLQWDCDNLTSKFIPDALAEIQATSDLIRTLL